MTKLTWRTKLTWSRSRRDLAVALGLAGAIVLGMALHFHVFSGQRVGDPVSYRGDALLALAIVSAARRGDFLPFFSKELPSLGAPFVANWNDWPIAEDWVMWLVGLLARPVGTVAAVNLGFTFATVTAGVSMFYVARRFGVRRDFSAFAGFLFGLSNYMFVRGVHHFSLTFAWMIPWNVLVSFWLASRRGVPFGSKRFRIAALTTLATSWSFIYYSFFAAQLFALGALSGLFRNGRKAKVAPMLALAGILGAGVLSVNLDTLVDLASHGLNRAAIARNPSDVEQYALKPINFFVSGHLHQFPFMREIWRRATVQTIVGGEHPGAYLGWLGDLALLLTAFSAMRAIARGQADRSLGFAATATWLVVAHSVGGLNSVMGLADVRVFRSVNRVSVVVLAVVLLYAAWWVSRRWAKGNPRVRWAAAALVGAAGTFEQVPMTDDANESIPGNRRIAEADRKLVAQMEDTLPPGSMVFELPAMDFPEVGPTYGVDGYEMFRPTYYAETLRFSHGDVKGRANSGWKFQVGSLPVPQMVAELKAKGFAAIYLNRKGYPDGAQRLLGELKANGCRVIGIADTQDTVAFAL